MKIQVLRISYVNGKWEFSSNDYSPMFAPTTFVACKILPGIRTGLTFLTSYRTVAPDQTIAKVFETKAIAMLDEYIAAFAYRTLRDEHVEKFFLKAIDHRLNSKKSFRESDLDLAIAQFKDATLDEFWQERLKRLVSRSNPD